MSLSRTLVLIALAGVAAAADDLTEHRAVNDLRVIGLSVDPFEGAGLKTNRGVRGGVGWFHSFVDEFEGDVTGILLGVELAHGSASGDAGADVSYNAVTLHGGFAYQTEFHPVHIEIDPFVGVGRARTASDVIGTDHSVFWEVGLRFGVFYTFDMGLQLGLDARWNSEDVYAHPPTSDKRVEVGSHGFTGGGSVGWRF